MMWTFIPSPSPAPLVWHLGPLPIRAYALAIIVGALVAIWWAEKRFVARGGEKGVIGDVAVWAIPFGIVGARIYHVATDWQLYFGATGHPGDIVKVWNGGIGIWGAVAGGALGAWIALKRRGVSFGLAADAVAPTLLVAQGIGRFGNYFNQELFGRPTTLPWGLEIDPEHRPAGFAEFATFHPTFLYESVWNVAMAGLLVLLDRRFKFTGGRAFLVYGMLYTAGRVWIEALRIDTVNHLGPFRFNVWTSIVVFAIAAAAFVWTGRKQAAAPASVSS
jgi:prolipoprotein diacylglyceryl transferase